MRSVLGLGFRVQYVISGGGESFLGLKQSRLDKLGLRKKLSPNDSRSMQLTSKANSISKPYTNVSWKPLLGVSTRTNARCLFVAAMLIGISTTTAVQAHVVSFHVLIFDCCWRRDLQKYQQALKPKP